MARALAGTLMQRELAERIGSSRSALIRWASQNGVSLDAHAYKPELRRRVLAYYELHGKTKTQKAFPDVSVRSIVERSYGKFKPRQIRWTDEQLIEAARMAGLVSPAAQAKYFNRPNANAGAIKSLWMKRFGFGQGSVNGMVHDTAKHLVTVRARYIKPLGESRDGKAAEFRRLILWVDMEKCLKPDVPPFIADAIRTLANFQRWLWRDENPKPRILRMIKARELPLDGGA
jgi:hypothetical protein